MSVVMWTLRLRGPKGKAATVQISSDATMKDFSDLVATQLAINGKNLQLTYRLGFPPRVVEYKIDDAVRTKFMNNDTVVVDTATPTAEPRQAVGATSTLPNGRTRGVAASVARATARPKTSTREPARGVHTLHATKPKAKPASQKRKERGDGVRLGASMEEESVVVDPAPSDSPGRKYSRTHAIHLKSKDDIGIALVEAVSGKSTDRVGKFFRAATKSAVEHQYEMTLANARLQGALAKRFEIQTMQSTQRISGTEGDGDDTSPKEMRVRFKESVRKWREETVMMLQPVELQAALKYILISGGETGREMLKPFNMAQLSPRVFWNIARLYNGDVAAGMAALVPDEDWSYLDTRTREMSKKAIEAKANEEAYMRWKNGGAVNDAPRHARPSSQEVIEIDSDDNSGIADDDQKKLHTAIEYAQQAEKKALREAMVRAVAARVEARARAAEESSALREQDTASHVPETQVAIGRDEEEEEDVEKTTTVYCDACNKARILSLAEATSTGVEGDGWTCIRLSDVGRDGSCDTVDDEVEQIAGPKLAHLLQKESNIQTRQDLANASLQTAIRSLAHPLEPNYSEVKANLQRIIDEARLDEVNDAIAEIVGAEDLVGLLELQKLGTPADLADTPVDLIASAISSYKTTVPIETVIEWQDLAREKVTRFSWMGEWRTI